MIRRAIGTTLAGICVLAGPCASSALADDAPVLTASATSISPGIPFTVTSTTGCGSQDEAQTVEFSFTDSAGTSFAVGSVDAADDGTWSDASVQLPVAGLDDSGAWQDDQVAAGAGTLDAVCSTADDSGDGSAGDGDPTDPLPTAYASLPLTVTGSAPQLSVSPAVTTGGSVTVTPASACAGSDVADVDVSIVAVGTGDDDGGDDPGDDNGDGTVDPVVTASTTTTAAGVWSPVSLTLPDDVATGDYAVTATCTVDGETTSSYDAQPLAVGTVLVSKPVCTARGASVVVSGSYGGQIAGATDDDDDLSLPATLKLVGNGPWKVFVQSAATDQLLLSQTVTCTKDQYDLTVTKPGVSARGQLQAKVCNTGRAAVTSILQTVSGKKTETVDKEILQPGDCTWLQGGDRLRAGESAKGQVLIDPPGKGSADATVEQKFTVRRSKH